MKIVFFGLGSIGQRHARILLKYYEHDLFAFRTHKGQKNCRLPIKKINSWEQFQEVNPDIAFITNPTSLHIETALECAKRKCILFIEKPLGSSTEKIKKLLNIAKKNKLSTYVAYNLRFHPIIVKLKKYSERYELLNLRVISSSYLPNWRPDQNYKENYSSQSKMGGGVILDLSHEIDYVHFLMNGIDQISGSFYRAADLTIDAEDCADILVKSKICRANIHINFMSHYRERTIRADFPNFSIFADLVTGSFKKYIKEKLIEEKNFTVDTDYTYRKQLEYFLSNMRNPKMMNNTYEAAHLLRKIINFKDNGNY